MGIKHKTLTEFIRNQERKFTKAFRRAEELGLPPPAVYKHSDNPIEDALKFNTIVLDFEDGSTRNNPRHICPFYDQLYHTLTSPIADLPLGRTFLSSFNNRIERGGEQLCVPISSFFIFRRLGFPQFMRRVFGLVELGYSSHTTTVR
jgi:hypothetical protein